MDGVREGRVGPKLEPPRTSTFRPSSITAPFKVDNADWISEATNVCTVGGDSAAASKMAVKMTLTFCGVNRAGRFTGMPSLLYISLRVARNAVWSNRRMTRGGWVATGITSMSVRFKAFWRESHNSPKRSFLVCIIFLPFEERSNMTPGLYCATTSNKPNETIKRSRSPKRVKAENGWNFMLFVFVLL